MNVVSDAQSAVLELILTVKMERGHSVEGSFGREFSSLGSYSRMKSEVVGDFIEKFAFFEKKTTACWKILEILFRNDSWRHRSTSCVQFL